MKKLLFFLLVFISVSVKGQVYQVMTQYGYETKRMNFDSTLQIPTVCGVPTLKSVVLPTKKAAIAFDSCNNRFYTYNPKTQTWSQVSGGGSTDTTSLSNRINTKIDSIKRSTDSVFAKINGTWYYQFKDSVGTFTTPNLQQVTNAGATTTNTIEVTALSSLLKLGYWDLSGNGLYYPIKEVDAYGNEFYVKTYDGDGGVYPELKIATDVSTNTYAKLDAASLELKGTTGESAVQLRKQNQATVSATDTLYFPDNDGALDTIATMRYARGQATATGLGSVYDTAGVLLARVRNSEATTLNRGEVVYIYGSTGNVASVKRANNKQDSTSSKTFGVVKNNIAAGDTGIIVTQGQIDKLNLGTFTEGDILWLDSVSGQFTKTKPSAPYHQVFLGVVERANNGNGLAYIKVQNGYELGELHNVSINGTANNEVLAYESSTNLWKGKSIATLLGYTPIAPADTSVFQRKNIAAYSFKANATNAAANVTDQAYYNPGVQTYSGTITWTGTTAPSGTTNHSYNWTRIGNLVTLNITLNYGTAGNALTAVTMALPADCPTPKEQSGLGAANEILYFGTGQVTTASTATNSNLVRAFLRVNAADNGYELGMSTSSAAYKNGNITVQYFVN